jgi:hypothetical protein
MTRVPRPWRSVGSRKNCSVMSTRVSRHPSRRMSYTSTGCSTVRAGRNETSRNDRSSVMMRTVLDARIAALADANAMPTQLAMRKRGPLSSTPVAIKTLIDGGVRATNLTRTPAVSVGTLVVHHDFLSQQTGPAIGPGKVPQLRRQPKRWRSR